MTIHWLEDDQYAKLKWHTRRQFDVILAVFKLHGMDVHIPGVVEQLMMVTEETWDVIRGDDKPIDLEIIKRKRVRK